MYGVGFCAECNRRSKYRVCNDCLEKKSEPNYPPLPPKEKTEREMLLEILERIEKLEQRFRAL